MDIFGPSSEKMIHVDVHTRSCVAEIYLNGIPIRRNTVEGAPFVSMPVHEFLIDGNNFLELVVNPGSTPSRARTENREMSAKGAFADVKLMRYPVGVYTSEENGEKLAHLHWQAQDEGEQKFPVLLSAHHQLGHWRGGWWWQQAEPFRLDEYNVKDITGFTRFIYDAYAQGKGDLIAKLARIFFEEAHNAYPARDSATLSEQFARSVAARAAEPGWTMLPFEPDLFDWRLCADDRLVECIRKDWQPIVAGTLPGKPIVFSFQMFLGRIRGKLLILR